MTKEEITELEKIIDESWNNKHLLLGGKILFNGFIEKQKEAINYTHSCEKLKAIDITEVEDIEDPYWREYIKGKQ